MNNVLSFRPNKKPDTRQVTSQPDLLIFLLRDSLRELVLELEYLKSHINQCDVTEIAKGLKSKKFASATPDPRERGRS